jgi:hypothetical protein
MLSALRFTLYALRFKLSAKECFTLYALRFALNNVPSESELAQCLRPSIKL